MMLLNAEHYPDPTAGLAISSAQNTGKQRVFSATPVFTAGSPKNYDVARISMNRGMQVSEMTMEELKPHLRTCAQSLGDPLKCVECRGGCIFGTRATALLEIETRSKSIKQIAGEKGAQIRKNRAMCEYAAALSSEDPIQYIIDHSNFKGDAVSARYSANAKLKRWKDTYGELPANVSDQKPAQPHLLQMPCLSKKVAAEEAAKEDENRKTQGASDIFITKLKDLREQLSSIQEQIDALVSNRDLIQHQISQIEDTAGLLDIAI